MYKKRKEIHSERDLRAAIQNLKISYNKIVLLIDYHMYQIVYQVFVDIKRSKNQLIIFRMISQNLNMIPFFKLRILISKVFSCFKMIMQQKTK